MFSSDKDFCRLEHFAAVVTESTVVRQEMQHWPHLAKDFIRSQTDRTHPNRLLKKAHLRRCARPARSNVLPCTPSLAGLLARLASGPL
jgi:hypothetical protein